MITTVGRRCWWILLLGLAAVAWSAPLLRADRSLAFRDSAYFYYPLYQYSGQQWSSGLVPLWNPLDDCGAPLLADSTSGVLYPGKLLFALPLPYALRFNLFVVGHLVLAMAACAYTARQWRASPTAACVAAFSYGFGGVLLSLTSNVPYLIGAAWLPLAVLYAERLVRRPSLRLVTLLAIVLAMMVLGGDPQVAYHTLLVTSLYVVVRWIRRRRTGRRRSAGNDHQWFAVWCRRCRRSALVHLLLAAVVAGLLTAVQVLPSLQWSARSSRAVFDEPRSVWELPTAVARGTSGTEIRQGLLGPGDEGAHLQAVYQFSVAPWRMPELIWPNFSGRLFPTFRHWQAALPHADRVWALSLYAGLIPVWVAICGAALRGRSPRRCWLTWMTLLALLCACGSYGLVWLLQRMSIVPANDWGPHVGGLYWLLVVALPGYVQFRYPAKWLLFAALGISLLAGCGWDRCLRRNHHRPRRLLAGVAWVSLFGALAAMVLRSWLVDRWSNQPGDAVIGPIDTGLAWWDLFSGCGQAAIVAAAAWLMLWLASTGPAATRPARPLEQIRGRFGPRLTGRVSFGLLILTLVDLAVANHWLMPTTAVAALEQASAAARHVPSEGSGGFTYRVFRPPQRYWVPETWSRQPDAHRIEQLLQWDRQTLYGKFHLLDQVPRLQAFRSIRAHDVQTYFDVARSENGSRGPGIDPRWTDLLAARYWLAPRQDTWPDGFKLLASGAGNSARDGGWQLLERPIALSRAWIAHDVRRRDPLESNDGHQQATSPSAIRRRTEQILWQDLAGDPSGRRAVVEIEDPGEPWRGLFDASSNEATSALRKSELRQTEPCRIVVDEPDRMLVRVELSRPGLLVIADLYDEDWRVRVTPASGAAQSAPLWRTNRILRGIPLTAGRFDVELTYRPRSFTIGSALSALTVLLVLACARWLRGSSRSAGYRAGNATR